MVFSSSAKLSCDEDKAWNNKAHIQCYHPHLFECYAEVKIALNWSNC
jgi:hypothetical protein